MSQIKVLKQIAGAICFRILWEGGLVYWFIAFLLLFCWYQIFFSALSIFSGVAGKSKIRTPTAS